jgi:hypothetical protein
MKAQCGEHGQVRVDGIGLALPAPGAARGLLGLEDLQPGGGKPDAVAAAALDRDDQPGPGGVVGDPGQQLGVAGAVVADRALCDRDTVRRGDPDLVSVAVGVNANDADRSSMADPLTAGPQWMIKRYPAARPAGPHPPLELGQPEGLGDH